MTRPQAAGLPTRVAAAVLMMSAGLWTPGAQAVSAEPTGSAPAVVAWPLALAAGTDTIAPYRLLDQAAPVGTSLRLGAAGLRVDPVTGMLFPSLRATLATTWLGGATWSARIGLSTQLDDPATRRAGLRATAPGLPGYGPAPGGFGATRLHLSAGGTLFRSVLWSVETDSLLRRRNPALDLGLNVSYSLSPALNFYGGYRWEGGQDDDPIGPGGARNGPTLGVRYRF